MRRNSIRSSPGINFRASFVQHLFMYFFFLSTMDDIDFASYPDDNKLQNLSKILFQWFMNNQMKTNPDKCHFICSTNDTVNLIVENQIIDNSE